MERVIAAPVKPAAAPLLARLKRWFTPLIVPLALLLAWDLGVRMTGTRLIPPPRDVAIMLYDFTFGGIYDDAFSKSIHIHFWKSVQRVYGGFFAAALVGIPLGLLIGRIRFVRELIDPTLQILRPVPVTAWLPLSMIFFGLGTNAALFVVFFCGFCPTPCIFPVVSGPFLPVRAQPDFRLPPRRLKTVRSGIDAGLEG